jgi:hypothetical protein
MRTNKLSEVAFILLLYPLVSSAFAMPPVQVPVAVEKVNLAPFNIKIDGTDDKKDGPKGPTKVGCGGDCGAGKGFQRPYLTPPTAAEKTVQEKLSQAEKEELDAANEYLWKLEKNDKPLAGSSLIIDWATDKLKDVVLGPAGELMDALEPEPIGISEFDKAKSKEDMRKLREHLEYEEKELQKQKQENALLYEKNSEILFPAPRAITSGRDPASAESQTRFENSIINRAKLKSEDFAVVAGHILRRSKIDAPIRMTIESSNMTSKILKSQAPANICVPTTNAETKACVVFGAQKGIPCFCNGPLGWTTPIQGVTTRRATGHYCRNGGAVQNIYESLPLGATCSIPVNVSINPGFPLYESLPGEIRKQ